MHNNHCHRLTAQLQLINYCYYYYYKRKWKDADICLIQCDARISIYKAPAHPTAQSVSDMYKLLKFGHVFS